MTQSTRAERNAQAIANISLGGPLGRKAAMGGFITISAQVLRVIVQLGSTAVLSRLLLPADFGLVAMAATVTAFITLFADIGLSRATVQRATLSQGVVSTLFYINIAFSLVLALIAVTIAPLGSWFFKDVRVEGIIIGLAIALPLSALGTQHGALLSRAMRWGAVQLAGVVGQIVALALAVLAWSWGWGYYALVVQTIAAAFVTTSILWLASDWRPSLFFDWRSTRDELRFGAYLTGFTLLNYFHRQLDKVLIGWRYGGAELGYYTRAYSLLLWPMALVSQSLSQTAIPMLSRLIEDAPRWRRAFLNLSAMSTIGTVGMCYVFFVVANPLIAVLLGPGWEQAQNIFRYLTVASVFTAIATSSGWAFISLGKTRELFIWSIISSPLFVLSFVVGLPWGAAGVAIAYSAAMAVLAPVYVAYTAHHCGIAFRQQMSVITPPLFAFALLAVPCTLVMHALRALNPVVQLAVGSVISALSYGVATGLLLWLLPAYRDVRASLLGFVRHRKLVIT